MTDNQETADVTAIVLSLRNDHGMGVNRIASMLGIGSGRVARIIDEAGLRREKREPDQAVRERVVELRKLGQSASAIAKEVGWSEPFVHRVLKTAGLNGWDAQRKLRAGQADPLTAEILRLYDTEQLPVVRVAAQLGVRKSRVSRVVQKAGVYREQDVLTDVEREKIVALRQENLSMPEIALRVRRSQAAVREHLEKLGMNERIRRPIRIEGDIAYVSLTQGKEAIIDAADVPLIESRSWSAVRVKRKGGVEWYASTGGNSSSLGHQLMHRVIAGNPEGRIVDHRDHNGLNNRRQNLRLTDHSGNMRNARRSKDTGMPRGVRMTKTGKYFRPIVAPYALCDTPEEAVADGRKVYLQLYGHEIVDTEKFMPDVIDPDTGEVLDG